MLGLVGRLVKKAEEQATAQAKEIADVRNKKDAAIKVQQDNEGKRQNEWPVKDLKAVLGYKVSAVKKEDWPQGTAAVVGKYGGLPSAREKLLQLAGILQEIDITDIPERVPPVIAVLPGYSLPMVKELTDRVAASPTTANAASVQLEVPMSSPPSAVTVAAATTVSPPAISPSAPCDLLSSWASS